MVHSRTIQKVDKLTRSQPKHPRDSDSNFWLKRKAPPVSGEVVTYMRAIGTENGVVCFLLNLTLFYCLPARPSAPAMFEILPVILTQPITLRLTLWCLHLAFTLRLLRKGSDVAFIIHLTHILLWFVKWFLSHGCSLSAMSRDSLSSLPLFFRTSSLACLYISHCIGVV